MREQLLVFTMKTKRNLKVAIITVERTWVHSLHDLLQIN